MKTAHDYLKVYFTSSLNGGEAGLCVAHDVHNNFTICKVVTGEQADLLYYILTNQSAKVEIGGNKE